MVSIANSQRVTNYQVNLRNRLGKQLDGRIFNLIIKDAGFTKKI